VPLPFCTSKDSLLTHNSKRTSPLRTPSSWRTVHLFSDINKFADESLNTVVNVFESPRRSENSASVLSE